MVMKTIPRNTRHAAVANRSILRKYRQKKLRRSTFLGVMIVVSAAIGALAGLIIVYCANLRDMRDLENYRPISNTLLYDDEGRVFGSFARERRVIAEYQDFPKVLYDAVLSIEDRDFETHPGFSISRLLGAAYRDLISRDTRQGASTLTMQLARNVFLSPEHTYSRKIRELLLAIQIERHFTKSQIFTLYANQIYLGSGVYGFATGAEFYFGKNVKDLTLEEAALLAALPKAPSNYSPIHNPERALWRRNIVINSMVEAGRVDPREAAAARSKPIQLHIHDDPNWLAPYFVEAIRQYLEQKYGVDTVHETGLRVYTTLDVDLQEAANRAVLDGLSAYEHRHGWHAHLENVNNFGENPRSYIMPEWHQPIQPGTYLHAVVLSVTSSSACLRFGPYTAIVHDEDVAWTNHSISDLLSVGDIVFVKIISLGTGKASVRLEEESSVQGALLAIDNATGDVKAMVGGRDFNQSKFNRATQALRQVGSSFKPYVYSAAVDQGAVPEDTVVDAPVTFMTASGPYTPHNYDGKFEGTITLRHALAESRNIPALKVAAHLGIKNVIGYARRFGIHEPIPAYLPIALGAVELTLAEHTSAFTVFPDDGLRFVPRYIVKVTDFDGNVLEETSPAVQDVIGVRTARIMTSMLRDVVLHGTAIAASRLKVPVAGKTGTTNDFTDAWFVGFSPAITCGVWVGFDEKKSLGNKETGARAALPVWTEFMESATAKDNSPRDFPTVPPDELFARQQGDYSSVALKEPSTGKTASVERQDTVPPSMPPKNRSLTQAVDGQDQ
jgi:penicillin-binding protein 1A